MGNDKNKLEQGDKNKSLAKAEQTTPEKSPSESESVAEEVISEIEQMPPEVVKTFRSFMAMFSQSSSGSRTHPIFDKFSDEHVHKYLDYIQRDDDHVYQLKKSNRWFYLLYALMALAVFIAAVVYLLPRDKELLEQLIYLIVLLGGGIGAGYGLSKRGK